MMNQKAHIIIFQNLKIIILKINLSNLINLIKNLLLHFHLVVFIINVALKQTKLMKVLFQLKLLRYNMDMKVIEKAGKILIGGKLIITEVVLLIISHLKELIHYQITQLHKKILIIILFITQKVNTNQIQIKELINLFKIKVLIITETAILIVIILLFQDKKKAVTQLLFYSNQLASKILQQQ